jgi:hypothetical protein
MIREFRDLAKQGVMAGDVGSVNIRHLGDLRSSFKDMPVVCLRRGKEETVKSFMDYYFHHPLRPGDKHRAIEKTTDADSIPARSVCCFPLIDAATPRQAYEFYWEMYQDLMDAVPPPVFNIRTDDLNDDTKLNELFGFLGIPDKDCRYLKERKFWTREETQGIKEVMRRARYV